jgi:hypothetical protein
VAGLTCVVRQARQHVSYEGASRTPRERSGSRQTAISSTGTLCSVTPVERFRVVIARAARQRSPIPMGRPSHSPSRRSQDGVASERRKGECRGTPSGTWRSRRPTSRCRRRRLVDADAVVRSCPRATPRCCASHVSGPNSRMRGRVVGCPVLEVLGVREPGRSARRELTHRGSPHSATVAAQLRPRPSRVVGKPDCRCQPEGSLGCLDTRNRGPEGGPCLVATTAVL